MVLSQIISFQPYSSLFHLTLPSQVVKVCTTGAMQSTSSSSSKGFTRYWKHHFPRMNIRFLDGSQGRSAVRCYSRNKLAGGESNQRLR